MNNSMLVFLGNALLVYGMDFNLANEAGYGLILVNLYMAYSLYQTPAIQKDFSSSEKFNSLPESAYFKPQIVKKKKFESNEEFMHDNMEDVIKKVKYNSDLIEKPLPRIK